jgi:hypothetical protein
VIVVRIWVDEADGSLRARTNHTLDVTSDAQVSWVAVTPEQISTAVRSFVKAFIAQSGEVPRHRRWPSAGGS